MGSTYSRKRVEDQSGFVDKPSQPRNEDTGKNNTIERCGKVTKQGLFSSTDKLNTIGRTVSNALRRNSRNAQQHNEILKPASYEEDDFSLGGSSVVGDRLCHYTRDSTIPAAFEQQVNDSNLLSSLSEKGSEETLHVQSQEDDNRNLETPHRREHLSTSEVISLHTGEEFDLMTVHELYNCLNDGTVNAYIMDPFYILILDIREQEKYESSHIVTAQPSGVIYTELVLLFNYGYVGGRTSLRDFTMVVICGESSCDLSDTSCRELEFYRELQDCGIQPSLLKGGYEAFHEQYPFFCSNVHITDEQERKQFLQTYPSEIIEGKLYQGRGDQATCKAVVENLNVTHIVNACTEHPNAFPDEVSYLNVNIEDLNSSNLKPYFSKCYEFIKDALDADGCVLVHCNLGMSRSSTLSLSYLMESRHWSLKEAYDFMKSKRQAVRPNRGFLRQLCEFEQELLGKKVTDPDDIWF